MANFAGPGEALGAVLTDGLFSCIANISNEVLSLSVPTFAYEFNYASAHNCNFRLGILEQTILSSAATTLTSDGIVE